MNRITSINGDRNFRRLIPLMLIFIVGFVKQTDGQVKVYMEPLTLPTYGVEKPEMMPDWGQYRYPYTMYDRLTNKKGSRTYKAIYVENEYVKALVLPELGGRLHGATDKTNGYEFLYNQKVIKPGLISTTGAWISGGVEWNFPIGHRPSGFRETDWTLTENSDGSKTGWVGEIDRLTGMRWSVGTTVHPGRNWVETKVRLYNCTPYVQRFQYWATSAVRATTNYQAVIPGEVMTGHEKREFYNWPVNEGVDMRFWKNIPAAGSYFAVDSESDYFGGYSPEENAGIVHFADHHIVRGKKLWTWGTAPAGRLWEKILTDGDLPYFEPQAGAYSDNQPSLFWIMPGETKIFSHFWFPVRGIGVYDYANLEGSLNLDLKDGKVMFGWSPTGVNKEAVVIISHKGKEIYKKKVNTDPANPYTAELKVPADSDLYELEMSVLSSAGDTLLHFQHQKPTNQPLPKPNPRPQSPDKVESLDLLYVIADRMNKYNDTEDAMKYYTEVLRRDKGDIRTNTALGEMAMKDGKFTEALQYFNTSLERDEDYFRAWYNKGLAELWTGDIKNAEKSLNRASYEQSWYATSHFELCQIALMQGQSMKALEHIERSISGNSDNTEAHAMKALIISQQGDYEKAMEIIQEKLKIDPMNHFLHAVKINVLKKSAASESEIKAAQENLDQILRLDNENYLETAIRFARCGLYLEAENILSELINKKVMITPLVYYHKAYYEHLSGKETTAVSDLKLASSISPEYCFPNRLESFSVLEWSLAINPKDANAHDLLAMLLYSRSRKDEAISHWEKSVDSNPVNAVAYRNLGLVYHEKGDLLKSRSAYQKALKADPTAGKVIVELGLLNKKMNIPLKEQINLFEENTSVVAGYNQAVSQLVELYMMAGRYKDGLSWLKKTHFNSWEGRYGIHQLWVQNNIQMGDLEMNSHNYQKALEYYNQALTYPLNLEVAEPPKTIHARKYYKIALAYNKLGNKEKAMEYYHKILSEEMRAGNPNQYYRGKALEALGKATEASEVYKQLLAFSEKELNVSTRAEDPSLNPDGKIKINRQAVNLYIRALALEGLGKNAEAESLHKEALAISPLLECSIF